MKPDKLYEMASTPEGRAKLIAESISHIQDPDTASRTTVEAVRAFVGGVKAIAEMLEPLEDQAFIDRADALAEALR